MPKTLVPRNALRPAGGNTLAQQYVPFRYADPMMNMVPQIPTAPVVDRVPKTSPLQMLDDVLTGYSRGAGKARVEDFEMMKDLMTRPKGVYEDLVEAARALAANPGAMVNALKSGAQQAVSSPTAFGEAVGSFGLPKLGKARGVMANMADEIPAMSYERAKRLFDDIKDRYVKGEMSFEEYSDRSNPLQKIIFDSEWKARVAETKGKPLPVFEDLMHIPEGTRLTVKQRSFPYEGTENAKVVGTHVLQTKGYGLQRLPIVEYADGRTRRLIDSDIIQVHMPRAVKSPVQD